MTQAISGVGASLRRGSGSSQPTYTAIAEVRNISGPSFSRETIDVTNLDSSGGYREKIPGFRDGGQVTFTANFTETGFITLKTDFEDENTQEYRVQMPASSGMTLDFSGFVIDMPLDIPFDDAITYDVTIEISGEVTVSS